MEINRPLLLLFLSVVTVYGESLLSVNDDELIQLIRTQEKLIVLFTKPNCDTCNKFENELQGIQEDFRKHLHAQTVKALNSHLARLYNPAKEPALVFFRHGIPLLYDGEADENEIYPFFEQNLAPAVKELTDKTFEHLTQAATGATTGDWFVMFYGASCVECQGLHAVWEGVGAQLRARGRGTAARVDAHLSGANTAKRFKVGKLPAFLFFRSGKMYRYELPKSDIKSFVAFAQDWYKNVKGETVPLLASPFDEILEWCVHTLRTSIAYVLDILSRHPWVWQVGGAGFGLVVLTGLIALIKAGRGRPKDQKKEKKSK